MSVSTNLRLTSLNCNSFKSSVEFICSLVHNNDIIFLQETWLMPDELTLPSTLCSAMDAHSISAVDTTEQILVGRPFGGLTIMWKKALAKNIRIKQYNDPRILGISVNLENRSVLFINVYLPSLRSGVTDDDFAPYLGRLSSIIAECEEENVCVIGDFNCAPGTERFSDAQSMFFDHNVKFYDYEKLPLNSYSHINYGHLTRSWLDHCAVSEGLCDAISCCELTEDFSTSDHCPLKLTLEMSYLPAVMADDVPDHRIKWDFSNGIHKERFSDRLDIELRRMNVEWSGECIITNCDRLDHRICVSAVYNRLNDCILKCGKEYFGYHTPVRKQVPGWNHLVREEYRNYREQFLRWKQVGSPRHGTSATAMRTSRARFKLSLRRCRNNELRLRNEALAQKLAANNTKDFWKHMRSLNPSHKLPFAIDGFTGSDIIAQKWKEEFESRFNCVDSSRSEMHLHPSNTDVDSVTVEEVLFLVGRLSNDKTSGYDGLPAEVFKFGSVLLLKILARLFTLMFLHRFLPLELMKVVLVPILKCKTANAGSSSNYRPIAITTAASKLLELIIQHRIDQFTQTSCSQFGFKSQHGCDMAIFSFKECVNLYVNAGSPVFACFLDASKAFDRVNHRKLFGKLISRGIPLYIVEILSYWYASQVYVVRWGKTFSSGFTVTNGIRQGGLISPILYNVYTDELNDMLKQSNLGCHVAGVCVNHISYADDMVLLAPSAKALQALLNICSDFANLNDIVYNSTKTVCMTFRPRSFRGLRVMKFQLNGNELDFVKEVKYLGHIIHETLNDEGDIRNQWKKFNTVGNVIIRKFSSCSDHVKRTLFRAHCSAIYCGSLWTNFTVAGLRRLKVCHNDILRRLIGVPRWTSASATFARAGLDNIDVLLRKISFSLRTRIVNSQNPILNAIYSSHGFKQSRLYSRWISIMEIVR